MYMHTYTFSLTHKEEKRKGLWGENIKYSMIPRHSINMDELLCSFKNFFNEPLPQCVYVCVCVRMMAEI